MINKFDLSKEGRAFVPVYMKKYDGLLYTILFKLDTGADLSTISKVDLIELLGYSQEWINQNAVKSETKTITSAGGECESAYYIVIPEANILGRDLQNWTFYIRLEDDKDFPNLLGIDILLNFNFTFNFNNGTLSIEPEWNPKIKKPLLENQKIGEIQS